jgi:hypothetical protein
MLADGMACKIFIKYRRPLNLVEVQAEASAAVVAPASVSPRG